MVYYVLSLKGHPEPSCLNGSDLSFQHIHSLYFGVLLKINLSNFRIKQIKKVLSASRAAVLNMRCCMSSTLALNTAETFHCCPTLKRLRFIFDPFAMHDESILWVLIKVANFQRGR